LLSHLDESTVEELGMAHIAAPDEVQRLAQRRRSCTLLGSAQFAQAVVAGETVERAAM
jgi:hypothetical protein